MSRVGGRRGWVALSLVAATLALPAAGGPATAPQATAASRWAPADRAAIHPGVPMVTRDAQCTGNFVFTDARGRVFVGYAAHCAAAGEATDTNGCRTRSYPLGTRVRFQEGGTAVGTGETVGRGRLAYSSWLAMATAGTRGAPCRFNDFALVRVGRRHVDRVNPTVPHWGGPVGLSRDGLPVGEQVFSYGSSSLRGGLEATNPKTGTSTGSDPSGWSHYVSTVTPGIPGDSGSGVLDSAGKAAGTLSTLGPLPGENGLGDLAKELRFARRHSGLPQLRLVRGTEPFTG